MSRALPFRNGSLALALHAYLSVAIFYLFLPTNIRTGWKGLRGTNTLAYFTSSSVMKKRVSNIDTYEVDAFKTFNSSLTTRLKTIVQLSLALIFASKTRAYQRGASSSCSIIPARTEKACQGQTH